MWFYVESESAKSIDDYYLVDLTPTRERPRGECECIHFVKEIGPKLSRGQFVAEQMCKHIREARIVMRLLIARGKYDEVLTKYPNE